MKNIKVNNGEYRIQNLSDEVIMSAHNLGNDLAIAITSTVLNKVGLGRDLNKDQLIKFFQELNPNLIEQSGLFEIKIVGGTSDNESIASFDKLMSILQLIDADKDIINIKTIDVCGNVHPDSFQLDCYHGGITAID